MNSGMSKSTPYGSTPKETIAIRILFALSFSHFLNDALQSLIPSIYPLLRENLGLSFTQIGIITFVYQITGSIFQPFIGVYADKHPKPYALAAGMTSTSAGLILLSQAQSMPTLTLAAGMIGFGSSVFHPEASRVARMASGGHPGLAQSLFQVGGNFGTSIGPLLAAAFIVPHGQRKVLWFSFAGLLAIYVLTQIGHWYRKNMFRILNKNRPSLIPLHERLSRRRVVGAVCVLLALIFSKYIYLASLTNYYTFFLIHKFGVSIQTSQIFLFLFLFAVAAGTIIGGPVGDRYGRKIVIWVSILGVAPFSLALPHLGLVMTGIFTVFIGLILASAFSAILVYAQELIPGKVGLVAGLFFGFAFGIAGIGAAFLGKLADHHGIDRVFDLCAWLPLIGLLTVFLPNIEPRKRKSSKHAHGHA